MALVIMKKKLALLGVSWFVFSSGRVLIPHVPLSVLSTRAFYFPGDLNCPRPSGGKKNPSPGPWTPGAARRVAPPTTQNGRWGRWDGGIGLGIGTPSVQCFAA